jgi:hypothetical protein
VFVLLSSGLEQIQDEDGAVGGLLGLVELLQDVFGFVQHLFGAVLVEQEGEEVVLLEPFCEFDLGDAAVPLVLHFICEFVDDLDAFEFLRGEVGFDEVEGGVGGHHADADFVFLLLEEAAEGVAEGQHGLFLDLEQQFRTAGEEVGVYLGEVEVDEMGELFCQFEVVLEGVEEVDQAAQV